ncbi:SMAD/FHA domain-containing protein [Rhodofomes roseus]|uniref:SMAD/FHA domain-containing protein n=1 Tax=Rhodofomes roseus TaxID=34475 RepID=A0ABQ8K507_9APHY|nr:SMAD/FHA domain-containing protein [Rhodofomes roseus]KAH9832006.1 SMAD/FHA domain-containing protein [Rhodofomes roseus]
MDPLSIGGESPAARQSILGSFLRPRPRGTSQSHPSPPADASRESPPPVVPPAEGARRRNAPGLQPSSSQAGLSQMLRRRRSAGALASNATPQGAAVAPRPATSANSPTHRIRLVPHLASRSSLRFEPICRDVREGDPPLRIGRFTDRSGLGLAAANALGSNKLAFKSKVVSRAHAEIWTEAGGRFLIKDTKSSSGTFLNHVRLSPANTESRPAELRDGDILQLGVDYQGGNEDIYKCVKIKIEMGREWQAHANPFNANALKQLKAISLPNNTTSKKTLPKSSLPDCCICLFAVTIHQALFIAPCSHAFHFKCIRPLLETHHPAFSCPLCRTFANLEEDVEVEIEGSVFSGDDDADGDASVVVAAVVATIADRPATGDSHHSSHSRSRERDRDPGAETEVEAEPRPMRGRVMHHFADADVDMADADGIALPPLPEGSPLMVARAWTAVNGERDGSVSPVPVPGPASMAMEVSEGEEDGGDGSGSGEGSSEVMVGGTLGEGHKRKR